MKKETFNNYEDTKNKYTNLLEENKKIQLEMENLKIENNKNNKKIAEENKKAREEFKIKLEKEKQYLANIGLDTSKKQNEIDIASFQLNKNNKIIDNLVDEIRMYKNKILNLEIQQKKYMNNVSIEKYNNLLEKNKK